MTTKSHQSRRDHASRSRDDITLWLDGLEAAKPRNHWTQPAPVRIKPAGWLARILAAMLGLGGNRR